MTTSYFSAICHPEPAYTEACLKHDIREIRCGLPGTSIFQTKARTDLSDDTDLCMDMLERQFAFAEKAGLKTNFMMHDACTGNQEFTSRGLSEIALLIDFFKRYRVDFVTISQPFLTNVIRNACPDIRIKISSGYDCADMGKFEFLLENLSVDAVVVSPMANKNFRLLKQVCDRWGSDRVEIECCEPCIMGCPYRCWHCQYLSHSKIVDSVDFAPQVDPCAADILHHRHVGMSAMFVRREDLDYYRKLGIFRFNIGSPGDSFQEAVECIRYYAGEGDEGFVPAYLKRKFPHYSRIDLRMMDGFYDKFFEGECDGTRYNCTDCDHCSKYAEQVFIDPLKWHEKVLPPPAEFFASLYFSKYANHVSTVSADKDSGLSRDLKSYLSSLISKIKTIFDDAVQSRIRSTVSENTFPQKPTRALWLKYLLHRMRREYQQYYNHRGIGDLLGSAHRSATEAWKVLVDFNPNNIGNWSLESMPAYNTTTRAEREVIHKMADLYGVESGLVEGYIASGGTEGNLFSVWVGRKFLEQFVAREAICLLRTDLTHYSVCKAADIAGVYEQVVEIDRNVWNMSVTALKKKIENLYEKGFRGMMISLTAGYTVGGTSDDLNQICAAVQVLKERLAGLRVFIWIDAALAGLVLPFTLSRFHPFENEMVQILVVDFHKFGGVPYPAGLILYRKALRSLVERDIPYALIKDNTLLGSRPGISAVAVWMSIHAMGTEGMQTIARNMIHRKNRLIRKIRRQFPEVEIVTDPNNVQMALIASKPLSVDFCRQHGLYPLAYRIRFEDKTETLNVYKMFFLPEFITS